MDEREIEGRIAAQAAFTEESLMKGMSTHLRYKNRFLYIYPIIGTVGLVLGLITWWMLDNVVLLSILFFPCLLLLLFTPYNRWLLRRNVRKLPNLGKTIEWLLDDEGIAGRGEGFTFNQTWDSMFEAMTTPAGLLIYPQKNVFHWLPRDAFADAGTFTAATVLVQQYVVPCRRFG